MSSSSQHMIEIGDKTIGLFAAAFGRARFRIERALENSGWALRKADVADERRTPRQRWSLYFMWHSISSAMASNSSPE